MRRTESGLVQSLVGQPDLEPAVLFEEIKVGDGETDPVDGDGVANVAVVEDRVCIGDGEEAAAVVDDQGGDDAFVFDEAGEHGEPVHVTMQEKMAGYVIFCFLLNTEFSHL